MYLSIDLTNLIKYNIYFTTNNNKLFFHTKMIIPVRCFSCGKVIAHKWDEFCELVGERTE